MTNISRIPRDIRLRQNHAEFMQWLIQHAGFWEDKLELYVLWCNWLSIDIKQADVSAIYQSAITIQ